MLQNYKNIQFILCNCNQGQLKKGVEKGGSYLFKNLQNIYQYNFKKTNIDFIDHQSNHFKQNFKHNYDLISQKTIQNLHRFNVFLGGDHSINQYILPHYFQKYKQDLHLIWLDAHCDLNTEKSSLTKNTHGMSVAKIFNIDHNNIYKKYNYKPNIQKQLTYIGPRDLDLFEIELIHNLDINFYSTYYCLYNSIYNFNIPKNKPIYISFDVDVLDSKYVPGTGTPVSNGLHIYHFLKIIQYLKQNGNILVGMDVVEYNPKLDIKQKSNHNISYLIKYILDQSQIK